MNDSSKLPPLDPIGLTRQLCEIESTTYHEGAVGDFLGDFLAGRGWEVEKTPVGQPGGGVTGGGGAGGGERNGGAALECICRSGGRDAGSGFFNAHGHRPAVYTFQRRREIHARSRSLGCEGNYCRAGCGGGSAANGRL